MAQNKLLWFGAQALGFNASKLESLHVFRSHAKTGLGSSKMLS